MKAAEVLRLYEKGERDFKGVSLRGQNFKGKDLSGVDFSGADIRSANFTNSNLTGAKFVKAKAGLQRLWAVGLVVVSLLLSVLSGLFSAFAGYFVALIFDSSSLESQIAGWVALSVTVVSLFLLLRKGIGPVAVALAAALAVAVILTLSLSIVGSVAVTSAAAIILAVVVVIAGSIAVVVTLALSLSVAGSIAVALAIAVTLAGSIVVTLAGSIAIAVAVAVTVAIAGSMTLTLVGAYIGWRALKGDKRDAWIRSIAIAFAAIGGTSFRGATLTDSDFSQAHLKSTDFRRALIRHIRWQDAGQLDRVRPGETYLNNSKIRELVLTGNGQGLSYDHLLNLEGINLRGANLVKADFTGSNLKDGALQGANLANASLIGANLNWTNLQNADLSNAKLVQTQLDEADLTGATLTGAYIEDWNITTRTKLNDIRCDYVFMRLPPEGSSDPNPHRKPDDWAKTFAEGEFVDFITPMVETLDLYHNQAVDPRAVAISFSDLRQQNPNADLEIISMEKRGQNLDKFNLRVRTSAQADRSQLHHQYFDRYEHLLTLPPQALVALLMEKEEKSQMLAGMVGTAINRPGNNIENTYQTQGDTIVSEQGSNAPKYDMRGAQFAGGFAETVQGDQIGGTLNNQASETPSLAEAAAEIQNLLKQLEASNPTATEVEQTAFLNIMIPPTRRERFIGALKSAGGGGGAAIEQIPDGAVLKALVERWQRPEG